jgi:hypothetical protein
VITWEIAPGVVAGNVFVAFSPTGTAGSWGSLNPDAPVASAVGMYQDSTLNMNSGAAIGFYRLLLTNVDGDFLSEPFGLYGDLTPREYGMVRALMHREFTEMRVTQGYPVWHCIPKTTGDPATNVDPDTGMISGIECANAASPSYGLPILGGFHPPVLTWIRAVTLSAGTLKDHETDMSPKETDVTAIRMMAFPRPSRGHMIVDPATDRRYLIMDEIKPFMLRGVMPVAYEAAMQFLSQGDPRYRYQLPDIDTKAYRRISYWSTVTPEPEPEP